MDRRSSSLAVRISFPLAALFGLSSLVGALHPEIPYRYESRLWTAQGAGQDLVDLLVVVPLLVLSAVFTMRGSRPARVVLGGTLIYAAYSLVLYTFAMHFNPLFLLYCAGLGLAFYALVDLFVDPETTGAHRWFGPRAPARSTGAFSVVLGLGFYALWLAEDIPALLSGSVPKSVADAALITNPVHVLDLSIVLPAFLIGGVSLWRRRPLGYWLAPMMLAFGVIMDVALAGMVWVLDRRQLSAGGPPLVMIFGVAALTLVVLGRFLRGADGVERGSQ